MKSKEEQAAEIRLRTLHEKASNLNDTVRKLEKQIPSLQEDVKRFNIKRDETINHLREEEKKVSVLRKLSAQVEETKREVDLFFVKAKKEHENVLKDVDRIRENLDQELKLLRERNRVLDSKEGTLNKKAEKIELDGLSLITETEAVRLISDSCQSSSESVKEQKNKNDETIEVLERREQQLDAEKGTLEFEKSQLAERNESLRIEKNNVEEIKKELEKQRQTINDDRRTFVKEQKNSVISLDARDKDLSEIKDSQDKKLDDLKTSALRLLKIARENNVMEYTHEIVEMLNSI